MNFKFMWFDLGGAVPYNKTNGVMELFRLTIIACGNILQKLEARNVCIIGTRKKQ